MTWRLPMTSFPCTIDPGIAAFPTGYLIHPRLLRELRAHGTALLLPLAPSGREFPGTNGSRNHSGRSAPGICGRSSPCGAVLACGPEFKARNLCSFICHSHSPQSGRKRGLPRLPPTPPYIRFRIRPPTTTVDRLALSRHAPYQAHTCISVTSVGFSRPRPRESWNIPLPSIKSVSIFHHFTTGNSISFLSTTVFLPPSPE